MAKIADILNSETGLSARGKINASFAKVPEYDATLAYVAGEMTNYAGILYVCILGGTGQQPDISPTYWAQITGGGDVIDSVHRIVDNADGTKKLAFEVSNITTGTTRTITVPDSDVTLRKSTVTTTDPTVNDDSTSGYDFFSTILNTTSDTAWACLDPTASNAFWVRFITDVDVASDTVAGIVEIATTAETDTGTDATRAVTPDGLQGSKYVVRYPSFRLVDSATDVAVATTVGGDLEIPVTGTITGIGAYVDTAGVTGTMTVDVNLNGATLMTTNKITIDDGEKSSRTAATAPALTTTAVTAGDVITVDIDAIQTTAAKGLTVWLSIRE